MFSERRRSVGAEPIDDGVHFRVWAPQRRRIAVRLEGASESIALAAEDDGYFAASAPNTHAGAHYRFFIDDDPHPCPDPASRFQPQGPHGPSRVVDPRRFRWSDEKWAGVSLKGAVISEIHIGTFTRAGTYRAAIERLPSLRDTGINVIELMPVNEFAGKFGWGYDGVDLWAPTRLYGEPDDLRAFVDAAHRHGIAVILDVVYNHIGPDGGYLSRFAGEYFTKKYKNEWGEAINFDGDRADGVRTFFTENAAYWIDEFHFDGLRVDATQSIFDESEPHILQEIVRAARAAAPHRELIIIAENEPQDVRIVTEYGFDAMWNDDWHHASAVVLTGLREAYYTDYFGRPQEFISMAKRGFLYQGQRYKWQKKRRGTPASRLKPAQFVAYLQNHDQIANSAHGQRVHELTTAGRLRAMTALLLLGPHTPMLFQGQEYGASAPFLYFADHEKELAEEVREGRRKFLSQFPSIASVQSELADPADPRTFEVCKLDEGSDAAILALHRDLIALRRSDDTFASQRADILDGAVIGPSAFLLRWMTESNADRLLFINLGPELHLDPAPEPLLAPPAGFRWEVLWSSEDPRYGGSGTHGLESDDENWRIPGNAAVAMKPVYFKPAKSAE